MSEHHLPRFNTELNIPTLLALATILVAGGAGWADLRGDLSRFDERTLMTTRALDAQNVALQSTVARLGTAERDIAVHHSELVSVTRRVNILEGGR